MGLGSGWNVDPRAVALTLAFAVGAVALLIALEGYYAQGFPLLVGWVVVYVLVLKRWTGGDGT